MHWKYAMSESIGARTGNHQAPASYSTVFPVSFSHVHLSVNVSSLYLAYHQAYVSFTTISSENIQVHFSSFRYWPFLCTPRFTSVLLTPSAVKVYSSFIVRDSAPSIVAPSSIVRVFTKSKYFGSQ
ncbi:hypothetical protein CLIB1423_17S01948 [[Candida] railenensis]|uniref:Uncharacterized protein n=1 Tax=[Candida] railenensis TaxID=45579 RepID=A0A9P0QS91_9ASCO|nr:hypothetical protein CLIB1423_17S01948 [[Candida] railenensis]